MRNLYVMRFSNNQGNTETYVAAKNEAEALKKTLKEFPLYRYGSLRVSDNLGDIIV